MTRSALITIALALCFPALAAGAEPKPFGVLDCVERDGVRFCEGAVGKTVSTFDGVPMDVNVTLPAKPAGGEDGDYPLLIMPHGYGGQKRPFDAPPPHEGSRRFAQRGYATLAQTSRGFFGSCGTPAARAARPQDCAAGWIHLDDLRYEIRDLQFLAGRLVDEGLVHPAADRRVRGLLRRVAVARAGHPARPHDARRPSGRAERRTGRLEEPARRTAMRIAAAAPYQTWSDLANALMPNGRALDYTVPARDDSIEPAGVAKASFVSGLFAEGQIDTAFALRGYFAPPGLDPRADITSWLARMDLGEPYDGDPNVASALRELRSYHSTLHLATGRAPAPLLISSGWTDDLFTVVEALRTRNALRARYPRTPVGLWLADFGHQRGANKEADIAVRQERITAWLDHYVRGVGPRPFDGIEARTHTCPASSRSDGPFRARTWAELHPGEVRLEHAAAKTLLSVPGNPLLGIPIDPVVAGNSPCASDAGGRPGRDRDLPAPGGERWRLHAARITDGDRPPGRHRPAPAGGRPPVGRRARRDADAGRRAACCGREATPARCSSSRPARGTSADGHVPEARAPRAGRALPASVQRRVLDRGERPRAAAPGPPAPGLGAGRARAGAAVPAAGRPPRRRGRPPAAHHRARPLCAARPWGPLPSLGPAGVARRGRAPGPPHVDHPPLAPARPQGHAPVAHPAAPRRTADGHVRGQDPPARGGGGPDPGAREVLLYLETILNRAQRFCETLPAASVTRMTTR